MQNALYVRMFTGYTEKESFEFVQITYRPIQSISIYLIYVRGYNNILNKYWIETIIWLRYFLSNGFECTNKIIRADTLAELATTNYKNENISSRSHVITSISLFTLRSEWLRSDLTGQQWKTINPFPLGWPSCDLLHLTQYFQENIV